MLLRNISDFFISSQIPLVIRHYPHPKSKEKAEGKKKNEYKTHKLSHKNDKPAWS
jgi:hypothetical protein